MIYVYNHAGPEWVRPNVPTQTWIAVNDPDKAVMDIGFNVLEHLKDHKRTEGVTTIVEVFDSETGTTLIYSLTCYIGGLSDGSDDEDIMRIDAVYLSHEVAMDSISPAFKPLCIASFNTSRSTRP